MDISGLINNEFILAFEDKSSPGTPHSRRQILQQNKYTNVLLIDCNVPAYQSFVESVNPDTLPIVYSTDGSSNTLIQLLRSKCTTISRLGFCFVTPNNNAPLRFLDNTPLFANNARTPTAKQEQVGTTSARGSVGVRGITEEDLSSKNIENGEILNSNVQFILNIINEFSIKNLDFLGCNTLNYSNWKNYYDYLAQSTGIIIGASDDKTGNLKYGGDWILETTSQDIELVYFTKSIENYSYLLDNVQWITSASLPTIENPRAMVCDGTYIYGSYANRSGSIFRIRIETKTVEPSWVSDNELKTDIWQMVIYNGELYGALSTGTVFRININTPTDATFNLFPKEQYIIFRGIAAYNNKLYITCYDTANIYVFNLQSFKIETRTFIGSTITSYYNSLSLSKPPNATTIGLSQLFIYNNYLYGATNESGTLMQNVFKWSLSSPLSDNSMNFMAQGTDPLVSNSILPDKVGGWVIVNNQLYFVRNEPKYIISRVNLDNLSDYTYNFYKLVLTNAAISSSLTSDNTYLYFHDNDIVQKLYQINLIRPTTPTPTVSIDSNNTNTVSYGNLQVSIIDPSNGLNDVYYQYSITGVNGDAFSTANTFATGVSSFSFYINNLFGLTDISYTINVVAKNTLGISNIASQTIVLYTLPKDITNCSVVYANGNINVSIRETSPTLYYYLNNVSYLYYLYTSGINQSGNALAYTLGANVSSASSSYTTNFAIPNIPVTTSKYKIYLIARNLLGNTVANAFSTNVYSIPSATVSFDTGNTKTVASGNLQVQITDISNISINDVYYYYSINNNDDASFANTFVKANVSPYSFLIPSITDISNTIYVKAVNPIGNSSPTANLQVIVYQTPRQPAIQLDLVGSGNVQVTITESSTTPYYYLNNVSYYLYAYNNSGGTNLSGNTSLLVYNKPSGILSNTNYTYANVVSYVNTGLSANTYTMYVIATNPFGNSVPVYANVSVYIYLPSAPYIDYANTISSTSGNLTVSIVDTVNRLDNGIYYWYSTDNISYSNSGVSKTTDTNYRFTINNTGDKNVPLVAGTYMLYIRAYNALGYATSPPVAVKVYTTPQLPTIVAENTYLSNYNRLTISILDSVNSSTNDIYYWYSTDNISYSNSGVSKSYGTAYQFSVSDTGNAQIPLSATTTYSLYVRAQNPLGNVTATIYPVSIPTRNILLSRWLEYEKYSNKFNQTYFKNFIDINGECIVRNGALSVEYDGTFAGNIYSSKNINLVGSAYIQTDITVNKNAVVNSNIAVKETATLNRLTTTGDASFNTNVFVTNNTNLNKLLVAGDSSFNGNMIVLKNATLNSYLTVNKDTTILGKLYTIDDTTLSGKLVVAKDTSLQSSLGVYGIANIYGYRNYPVINFLRTVNIQADYNFLERSSIVDPINSDASVNNPLVLNTFTNTTDASLESSSKVNISSSGINYYYGGGNVSRYFNDGGLLTNPYPSQNITNVTVHILVNLVSSDSKISWNLLEILTKNDASYSSLYTFKLISDTGVNVDGSNNRFTISNNSLTSSILNNYTFKSDTDMWISVSQNIINGGSTIYLNGNVLCTFQSVAASSALQDYIVYSIGYFRSISTLDQTVTSGEKTIKRIIIDYNGKYTNASVPQVIDVFNINKSLYVAPVFNVNSDSIAVNGNANIQDKLDVTGNTTINSKLTVIGDVSFGTNLYVAKNTNINKQLAVVEDVSFGSKLYVANDATLNKTLTVMDDALFNKNISANTLSIIGDVSFVSPTGTLYANNIKLKRSPGLTGTITTIDSNTISTGLINVDSLNVSNGIFPGYITTPGLITTAQFTSPATDNNQYPTQIKGGIITADSISLVGTGDDALTRHNSLTCRYLLSNDTITARGVIRGASIISESTLESSESIISQKNIIAASFKTKLAFAPIDAADSDGSVYVEKLVRAGYFAVNGEPEVLGQISGIQLKASQNITGNTFNTANNLFSVSSNGDLTAASIIINGTITIAGGTELSTINAANTITAGGLITAAAFFTPNMEIPDTGGISVTTVKANGNITTSGIVTAASFKTDGQITTTGQAAVATINASGTITSGGEMTAVSFKTSNSSCIITSTGAVTASSFNTTGQATVATINASGTITSGGEITASGTITSGGEITAVSFKTTGAVPPDTGGISVTTVKASSTVTAVSFNATSDKRLKKNINDMPSQWENIKALKPAEYNWTENSKYDCGFIAQQIYTVYPHLRPKLENVIIEEDCPVSLDGNPVFYTIDYGKMTPYLCKGLQEVMSETEQLKQEIAELKAQIQSLLKK